GNGRVLLSAARGISLGGVDVSSSGPLGRGGQVLLVNFGASDVLAAGNITADGALTGGDVRLVSAGTIDQGFNAILARGLSGTGGSVFLAADTARNTNKFFTFRARTVHLRGFTPGGHPNIITRPTLVGG